MRIPDLRGILQAVTAAWLLLFALSASAKEDCVPPAFYTSLPRDREWYYGVARDPDTDKAREQALRNLAKQAAGDVEAWPNEKVTALAGPCRDKWEVAAGVGKLLPTSSLLAGWEQDDFERCAGQSYVLVRIQKERVERFLKESGKFKKDLVASLGRRLEKVESDVASLLARVERLEKGLQALPDKRDGADVAKTVARVRSDLKAGKPKAEVEKALASAEDEFSKLEERMKGYAAKHDALEASRLAALKNEKAPELKALLASVEAGKWGFPEAGRIVGIYNDARDYAGLRDFSRSLLKRKDLKNLDGHDDFVAYMGIVADIHLKDQDAQMKDGEAFLAKYPSSDMFQAVKSQLDAAIMVSRMPKAAAPAPAPALEPDPCVQ